MNKLLLPEFHSLIAEYDIIGLQESKTDSLDTLNIPGYKLFCKHRKDIAKKKSGGIILIYKECLDKYVTFIESESKQVLWFKLSNSLTKCGNILCGVTYIPPENSVYAVESPYSEIEEELRHLIDANNCASVIIFSDYNSRVRNMSDFVLPDSDIFQYNGLNEMYEELRNDLCYFEQNSRFVSLQRQNPDGGMNNYGYRLIDFCCDNSIYIMNGRTKGNSSKQNTCKNVSTVDYFRMSPCLFKYVKMLNVLDFCELFSDVHCAVSMVLNVAYDSSSNNNRSYLEKTKLWDEEKKDLFVENLDGAKLDNILSNIRDIENSQDISQSVVNGIAESLSEVFNSSSKASFGSVKYPKFQNSVKKPPHWFMVNVKKQEMTFIRQIFYTSCDIQMLTNIK